jgi:hypothetical protein
MSGARVSQVSVVRFRMRSTRDFERSQLMSLARKTSVFLRVRSTQSLVQSSEGHQVLRSNRACATETLYFAGHNPVWRNMMPAIRSLVISGMRAIKNSVKENMRARNSFGRVVCEPWRGLAKCNAGHESFGQIVVRAGRWLGRGRCEPGNVWSKENAGQEIVVYRGHAGHVLFWLG